VSSKFQGVNLFALAGVGYTKLTAKKGIISSNYGKDLTGSAFGFMGGVGASYDINSMISVGVKYLKFSGATKQASSKSTTAFNGPQYMLATLGFNFPS
jgi:opacity protein-like surface antigen